MRYKSMLLAPGKTGKLNYVCIDFKMLKSIIVSLTTDKWQWVLLAEYLLMKGYCLLIPPCININIANL